ncbi:hypothetical protein HU200_060739 [Digitaria exilis]|uniref:BHLH domain-containing protein n=1 Tax=Digitaria exilis TaxID=1010633 RepID=A0A835AA98_9POAL|nr:hypothetical protein HU200_060739 [Digitaria exilis]
MALSASPPVQEELQTERRLKNQLAAAVKTRKIAKSVELTADQLVMQRSEQLRELYEALLSGEPDRRRAVRPDLSDTEWYYVVCMTYSFRPGQGLPGRSFASNEHVWLCNAHLADSKAFPRALLAKTIVCIPLMGSVLELGTTDPPNHHIFLGDAVSGMLEGAEPQPPTDIIVFDDLNNDATETMIAGGQELGEAESLSNPSLEHITKEIDDFYTHCEEMDLQALEDSWMIMDGSFDIPPSLQPEPGAANTNDAAVASTTPVEDSRATSFRAWSRSDSDEVAMPVTEEPQKLLKKVVTGGAWSENCGGGTTTTQETSIKNHVMSERKRREKLNEMFLILKSLRKGSELGGDMEREHPWVPSKDGTSNVTVTVSDKDVLLEVQCRWEELLMTRVFDVIKSLHLDVLSVQASVPDGFMGLKIRAQGMHNMMEGKRVERPMAVELELEPMMATTEPVTPTLYSMPNGLGTSQRMRQSC